MSMTARRLLVLCAATALATATAASAARAQEAPHEESIEEVAKRITKALKANEDALTRLARGESATPEPVDIELPEGSRTPPPESASGGGGGGEASGGSSGGGGESGGESGGAGSAGGEAASGLEELLRSSGRQGSSVVDGLGELLKRVKNRKGQGGGSGGPPQDEGSSGEKPQNSKKGQEPEKDPLADNDPQNPDDKPGGKDPKDGRKDDTPPPDDANPPSSDKSKRDPSSRRGLFFAKLPDKVRRAVENGDFDQVPEKYRALVAEWTKLLAEKDLEDAEREE